jgi:hypothetical protein
MPALSARGNNCRDVLVGNDAGQADAAQSILVAVRQVGFLGWRQVAIPLCY